jgi:large subunit ribosomal protein L3
MVQGLIAKKLGMTGIFTPEGKHVPTTVLEVGPCVVTQIKTEATDGYKALQLGFGVRKKSRINKPRQGHLAKSGGGAFAVLKEFSVEAPESYTLGQVLNLDLFKIGEKVDLIGITKGRGFQGVIKRHGFHGGKDTHGGMNHRVPGSIGASAWPSRVVKGKKLPGRLGSSRKTVKNLEIIDIRPDENLILLKGAVPGFRSGIVFIRKPNH